MNNCIEKMRFKIVFNQKSFLNGACVSKRRGEQYLIEINKDFDTVELWYSSLVHELAHIYCGHLGEDPEQRWKARAHLNQNQREIESESVAYLVCSRQGLKTKAMEYVAGYLKAPERDLTLISIKSILDAATAIEDMGDRYISPSRRSADSHTTNKEGPLYH